MQFQIFRGSDQQFYFRIVGANGETMASSEGYTRKENAKHAIDVIKAGAAGAMVVDQT